MFSISTAVKVILTVIVLITYTGLAIIFIGMLFGPLIKLFGGL